MYKFFKFILAAFISVTIIYISGPIYYYLKEKPEKLYEAIDKATKIVVTLQNRDNKILYTSEDKQDIQSFKKSLHLDPKIEFDFAACRGELGITFYNSNTKLANIGYLTNNHINEFHIPDIEYTAIKDKELLEKWFQERNITMIKRSK